MCNVQIFQLYPCYFRFLPQAPNYLWLPKPHSSKLPKTFLLANFFLKEKLFLTSKSVKIAATKKSSKPTCFAHEASW